MNPELFLSFGFFIALIAVSVPALTAWVIVRYLVRRRPMPEGPALTKRELEQLVETAVRRAMAPLEARMERLERQLLPPPPMAPRPPLSREAEQPERPQRPG